MLNNSKTIRHFLVFSLLVTILFLTTCTEKINAPLADRHFNKFWLFRKGEVPEAASPDIDDSAWRSLDLPHDWAIEGLFDATYNARTIIGIHCSPIRFALKINIV